MQTRRIGRDDVALLQQLAQNDVDFDLAEREASRAPLSREQAEAYLADPNVLHWVAEANGEVLGFLQCQIIRKHAGNPIELLLYEIGVKAEARRRGVGRSLMEAMFAWMAEHRVSETWVLADNDEAVAFYEACGFTRSTEMAAYMTCER